jgi:lipopolysaccharide/colanic/teichoic acid biosynthesis glycosyltransferase
MYDDVATLSSLDPRLFDVADDRERSLRTVQRGGAVARPRVQLFRRRYEISKRALDLALCVAVLPVAVVVMAVCAVLIWIDDPGPVLFVQQRTGRGGRRFHMYKFRTMVRNAPELKEKLAHLNQLSGPDFKISNDPRVTRVGQLLRRTSLDELPQVFNVLRGQMSVVGPRPTSFEASTYSLWHTERLEVLPGITGLWQVRGRSDVDFDDRVRLDVEYVRSRSLALDLRIIVATLVAVFRARGAY